MNPKQAVDEGALGSAFLFQKLGNLELVHAAMTRCLPFVTNEKASDPAIEDQHPPIFVGWRRATCATVKLSLDNGHVRSLARLSGKHMGTKPLMLQRPGMPRQQLR
jgi:hypothetical protein